MKIVYVAGPYRGKTAWQVAQNIRAAEEIGYLVAQSGAMPLIPHANTAHFDGEFDDKFWLDGTMELLRRCDAVMLHPKWMHSKGASAECSEAQKLNLPVFRSGHPEVWSDLIKWVNGTPIEDIWNTTEREAKRAAYKAGLGGE